jgi:uncharacterized protein
MKYIKSDNINFALSNLPQLVFEVTDACNLQCKYCAYGDLYDDYDERTDNTLSIKKAIKLIDYLADFWNSGRNTSSKGNTFISFYGGEPLLNMPFIRAVVGHVKKNIHCSSRTFSFSMTTNGLLLNKYMDFLYEHDFHLLVSLDGNKENTSYRTDKAGNNAFDRIVKNVDTLREKYPEYFLERVNFNSVLHNKNSVEDIYRFFKDKYNKTPQIGELNDVGIRDEMKYEFKKIYKNHNESLHQSEHYEEIERDLFMKTGSYRSVALFLHQYSGFVFKDYTDLLFDSSLKKNTPTGTCLPFSKKMYITVNGKILPCERIGHQFALGEITESEINLDPGAIAEKYNTYYAKFEKQCGSCKNTKACIQCIFNISNLEETPVCHGYMNEAAFSNYTNIQMSFLEKNPEAYKKLMEEVIVI